MEDDVLSMINEEPTEESVDVDVKDMIDPESGGQPSDQDEPTDTDEPVEDTVDGETDTQEDEPEPDEPSNETDNPSEPEADQLDVAKYFEGYSSKDEVNAALERAKQFTPEVEQEYLKLKQDAERLETLQSEVKSLKERQPFNDVKFYQLDKLSKEDPDKAAILTRYQFGDNSAESVIKLKMMLENPGIAEKNPDFFQQTLEKTYDDFYNGVEGDRDYEYAKTKMEVDALAARKVLDGELSKIEVPAIKTEEQQKEETAQFFKDWTTGHHRSLKLKKLLVRLIFQYKIRRMQKKQMSICLLIFQRRI